MPSFKEDDNEDTPNRKISSQRIMEELNWSPKHIHPLSKATKAC